MAFDTLMIYDRNVFLPLSHKHEEPLRPQEVCQRSGGRGLEGPGSVQLAICVSEIVKIVIAFVDTCSLHRVVVRQVLHLGVMVPCSQ